MLSQASQLGPPLGKTNLNFRGFVFYIFLTANVLKEKPFYSRILLALPLPTQMRISTNSSTLFYKKSQI